MPDLDRSKPKGYEMSDITWNRSVEEIDLALNGDYRAIHPEQGETAFNRDVALLVKDEQGARLEPLFTPDEPLDKYTYVRRMMERAKERPEAQLVTHIPGESSIKSVTIDTDLRRAKSFRNEPYFSAKLSSASKSGLMDPPADEPPLVPPTEPHYTGPREPEAPGLGAWLLRIVTLGIAGRKRFRQYALEKANYDTEMNAHQEKMTRYEKELADYNAARPAYDERQKQRKAAWKSKAEEFQRTLSEGWLKNAKEEKKLLNEPAAQERLERMEKEQEERLAREEAEHLVSDTVEQIDQEIRQLDSYRENVERYLGAQADPRPGWATRDELTGLTFQPPEGIDNADFSALALAACGQLDTMTNLKYVSGSSGYQVFADVKQDQLEIQRYNNAGTLLVDNTLGVGDGKVDNRVSMLSEGINRARVKSDSAWKEYEKGNLQPAVDILREGVRYFATGLLMLETTTSTSSRGSYAVAVSLTDCLDKHPELAVELNEPKDQKAIQQLRGFRKLFELRKEGLEARKEYLLTDPSDQKKREELLARSYQTCGVDAGTKLSSNEWSFRPENERLKEKSYFGKMDPDRNDMVWIRHTEEHRALPTIFTATLTPEGLENVKKSVTDLVKETEAFQKLAKLSNEEYCAKMRHSPDSFVDENSITIDGQRIIQEKQKKLAQSAPEKKQPEKTAQKAKEPKAPERKAPEKKKESGPSL